MTRKQEILKCRVEDEQKGFRALLDLKSCGAKMGKKDGELWDDSALIDAFEDAISSYKMMHGMKQNDGFKEESQDDGDVAQKEIADEEDVNSHVENSTSEADASSNSLAEAASPTNDQEAFEEAANVTLEPERVEDYSNVQPVAEYNSLVNQYYELQEKLQATWQQLQQFGYSGDQCPQNTNEINLSESTAEVKEASVLSSDAIRADFVTTHVKQNNDAVERKSELWQQNNDQCLGSAGVQGGYSMYQGQSSTDSHSQPAAICCCYSCTDKCMVYSSCCADACRLCTDAVPGYVSEKFHTLGDNDLIRVAMGAAEKAISSIKIRTADQQEGRGQISIESMGKNFEKNCSETDISTVLNAWFSAGLVTGKYLAEQSNSSGQKG